eukprot:gene805-10542_t
MATTLLKQDSVLGIDQILVHIGEFGRFQIILEIIACLLQIPYTLMILLPYFTQDSPSWKCVSNSTVCNVTGELASSDKLRCQIPRSEWEYSMPKDYSIVTEFDLYCGTETYAYLATSMIFVAWAIGSVILGWLADRFGRWKVLIPAHVCLVTVGLLNAFSPNFTVYIITRFLVGFSIPGIMVPTFVLVSEFVGPKHRPLAGILLWGFFALGLIILGLQAYFIRKWKLLTIICTAPYIITFPLLKFIPESIRWLRISGQSEKAMEILEKIARVNKKEFPNAVLEPLAPTIKEKRGSLLDIFRPCKMAIKTFIQGYAWMVEGMVYYSVALAADDIGGSNRYANYILTSLVDLPAVLTGIYAFWPKIRVALGVLGKFFVATSFDSIYTWSVELYPTVVRGEGMGYLQVMSRIGAALAPWVTKWLIGYAVIYGSHGFLPFLVLGSSSLVASISLLWLPETRDSATAETFEHFEKKNAELVDGKLLADMGEDDKFANGEKC